MRGGNGDDDIILIMVVLMVVLVFGTIAIGTVKSSQGSISKDEFIELIGLEEMVRKLCYSNISDKECYVYCMDTDLEFTTCKEIVEEKQFREGLG